MISPKRVPASTCNKKTNKIRMATRKTYVLSRGEEVVDIERVPPPVPTHPAQSIHDRPQGTAAHVGEEYRPHRHHQHVGRGQSRTQHTACRAGSV